MKLLLCSLFGHKWLASGWTSKTIERFNGNDTDISENAIRHLRKCERCKLKDYVDELGSNLQIRFDGYKKKYGKEVIYTNEFSFIWSDK